MYDDRPAPRDFTPEGSPDDGDELSEGAPAYDPAKQAPVPEETDTPVTDTIVTDTPVDEIVDVENPEDVVYDLEDEEDEV